MESFEQNFDHIMGFADAINYLWEPVLMLFLLGCSAFFSGTETAFFNFSRRQVSFLKKSESKIQNLAANLLNKPGQLLSCLLFGNMMVNVLFFAITSVIAVRVESQIGITAAAGFAIVAFVVLVIVGEILPKSLAYINSKSLSVAVTPLLFLCIQIFRPILFVFRFFVVEPALRLLLGPTKKSKPITTGEFKVLIEQMRKRDQLTADENKLLSEVIELRHLKIKDCLVPRVDMIACKVTDTSEQICEVMKKKQLTKVAVYVKSIDNIVGLVYLRQLLLRTDTSADKLVQPVNFVPEQKTIESLLEFFRTSHTDIAIVVDEYGGIAGSISLENIAEELLGPIESINQIEPVEQLGPLRYRLAGNLGIHDWMTSFGIDPAENRVSTIAGLVTVLLGKIPKEGDVARMQNLKFTVERVKRHRIETIILTFEPIGDNDK